MPVFEIDDIRDRRVQMFASMTEAQLRRIRYDDAEVSDGIFIVESPKVIAVALAQGFRPVALLCERRHLAGDAAAIIADIDKDIPIYTGERDTLASLTGYTLTRGVLCAMQRPTPRTDAEVCRGAKRVAVIDSVCDTTNIGAIFRSAAALGIDAVLLTPGSCDPLNRRSVRVSMGSVFLVPWAVIEDDVCLRLKQLGLSSAAMALRDNSVSIDDAALNGEARLALILGTEGDGLDDAVIDNADYVVRIPMYHNVDSLNVGAAAAVAFWQLRTKDLAQ